MKFTLDLSYITELDNKLIDAGYGKITVHSLHFDRYVSEKQMEVNRKLFKNMTDDEKNQYFKSEEYENIQRTYGKSLEDVLKTFATKFNIHQIDDDTSTREHFRSNWDLYFWSDRGWNGKNYMDCFALTFNENRTVEENMALLDNIYSLLNEIKNDNVCCRIQYDAALDEQAISNAAQNVFDNIAGKFIKRGGFDGKIKIVNENGNNTEYGFFKKGAKSKYYRVSNAELAAMYL